MTDHINNVLKQATTTFTCPPELFDSNLQLLSSLLDKTIAADVGLSLNSQCLTTDFWNTPRKAPTTCIDIYEDSNLTIIIFILKPGGQLPLHNHPAMHGLIKVIAGQVKITSYSLNTQKTEEVDKDIEFYPHPVVTAELNSSEIVDVNSTPCILEPNNKNLHEIESLNGPAALLDILAPPYGTSIPDKGPRLCSFYSILKEALPNVFLLKEIDLPSNYWSDSYPYAGPQLNI